MKLKFKVQTKIRKPVGEVFDAIYNPTKLTKYFATGSASAPLDEGTTVYWGFADFENGKTFPVKVKKMVKNELIVFEWGSAEGGYDTRVEIRFEPIDEQSTLLSISESGWKETDKGLEASYQNCEGWTQMSASLKVFLEHGINLRQGYY